MAKFVLFRIDILIRRLLEIFDVWLEKFLSPSRQWSPERLAITFVPVLTVLVAFLGWLALSPAAQPRMSVRSENGQVVATIDVPFGLTNSSLGSTTLENFTVTKTRDGLHTKYEAVITDFLEPETGYELTVPRIRTLRAPFGSSASWSFTTPAKPAIIGVEPERKSGEMVADNSRFIVTLSQADRFNLLHLDAVITPDIDTWIYPSDSDPTKLYIEARNLMAQGGKSELVLQELDKNGAEREVKRYAFTTPAAPSINSDTKQLSSASGEFTYTFGTLMERDSVVIDTGSLKAELEWNNDATITVKYSDAKPGQTYKLILKKGAQTISGGTLRSDLPFTSLVTNGVITVSSPQAGRSVEPNTPIKFAFNQAVDKKSAEQAVSLSPSVSGTYRWDGSSTLIFLPQGMSYQTSYTVTVSRSVQPLFGLPMDANRSFTVTTNPQSRRLGLPFFRQVYSLSCEEASLRMILAKKGIAATDMQIVQRVGYNPSPRDTANNYWDDPGEMFVGDINGRMGVTGWGVYAEPIARAARSYGLNAHAYYNVDARFVAQQIYANKAVIIWGARNSSAPDGWNTKNGYRFAAKNDHVMVVDGVVGTADNPLSFYIHNPLSTTVSYTTPQLNNYLGAYNNALNMVVVVDL